MFQEGVKPGEETRMPMVPLPVPSLPPTMTSCSCIRISYFLRVIYPFSVHLAEFFKRPDFFFFFFNDCHLLLCQHFPLSQTNRRRSGLNDVTCICGEFIWWWNVFSTAKNPSYSKYYFSCLNRDLYGEKKWEDFSFAFKPRLTRNNYDLKCRGLFHSLTNESWKCSNKLSWIG